MSELDVSSFWDHLEVLRKVLFRCLIVWGIGAIVAFCFKTQSLHWNHLVSFVFLVIAVFFAFLK